MNLLKKCKTLGLITGLAMLALPVLMPAAVGAISRVGPDQSEDGGYGGSSPRYVLEQTPSNVILNITVPVYTPTRPTGTVAIELRNVRYPYTATSSDRPPVRIEGNNYTSSGVINLPASRFTLDSSTGQYRALVTAALQTRNGDRYRECVRTEADDESCYRDIAMFTLRAPSGMNIGIAGGRRYSTVSSNFPTGNTFYNYSIPFATPCHVTSGRSGTITLRDLDSGEGGNRGGTVEVEVINADTGAPVRIDTSGSMSTNGAEYSLTMTFQPNQRYRLIVNNMHTLNSIDYQFPFDNISYLTRCNWAISQDAAYIQQYDINDNLTGDPLGTVVNNARPGERYGFFYRWINNGPAPTSRPVNILRNYTYPSASSADTVLQTAPVNRPAGGLLYDGPAGHTGRIPQSAVGGSYCLQTGVQPRSSSNNNRLGGSRLCVNVPYSYALTPTITVPTGDGVVEADGPIVVEGRVQNSGATRSHPDINWRIIQVEYGPGTSTIPRSSGGVHDSDPCSYFIGNSTCDVLESGIEGSITQGGHTAHEGEGGVDNLPVGTRVCFAISVQRNSSSSSAWRHSPLVCLTVGKYPKVQVHGGNLSVGRTFSGDTADTSASSVVTRTVTVGDSPSRTFGSWAEYGILAPGQIRFMASGSGLAGGATSSEQSRWSDLTFTRQSAAGSFGSYIYERSELPNVAAMYPVGPATPSVSGSVSPGSLPGTASSGRVVTASGNLTINGGQLIQGRWAVLHAPGAHVIINGNIEYASGPFTRPDQIPQLIIIAQNITINSNVERVDAWLIATGALATCNQRGNAVTLSGGSFYNSSGAHLTDRECAQPLLVNGPVMADRLFLRRTGGSERATPMNPGGPGEPAEVFNLRPDAYIWLHTQMNARGTYQTTSVRELPPRY